MGMCCRCPLMLVQTEKNPKGQGRTVPESGGQRSMAGRAVCMRRVTLGTQGKAMLPCTLLWHQPAVTAASSSSLLVRRVDASVHGCRSQVAIEDGQDTCGERVCLERMRRVCHARHARAAEMGLHVRQGCSQASAAGKKKHSPSWSSAVVPTMGTGSALGLATSARVSGVVPRSAASWGAPFSSSAWVSTHGHCLRFGLRCVARV